MRSNFKLELEERPGGGGLSRRAPFDGADDVIDAADGDGGVGADLRPVGLFVGFLERRPGAEQVSVMDAGAGHRAAADLESGHRHLDHLLGDVVGDIDRRSERGDLVGEFRNPGTKQCYGRVELLDRGERVGDYRGQLGPVDGGHRVLASDQCKAQLGVAACMGSSVAAAAS